MGWGLGNVGGGGAANTITVSVESGSLVNATNGEKTVSTTSVDGVAVLKVPTPGVWTVTANISGSTVTETIEVMDNFEIKLDGVYGISRNITALSPAWARTDNAVGLTATASVGTSAGSSDFDDIYPWSEIKRETLPTGDVMVKIPKFYFARYREGNVEYIKISRIPKSSFTLHPAFNHGGIESECVYVGAYKTSSNNRSVSGAMPQVSQTRSAMRTNAKAKGAGWGLVDISTLSAIQMLILVEFANNDVQTVIGRGYCDGASQACQVGTCDNVPNLTGRPSGTDVLLDVVWRGIEGFWGNTSEWLDGINLNNGIYYTCNDPAKYADDTAENYDQLSFTANTNWRSSYITQEGLDSGNNPHIMLPSAAGNGSDVTYQCDGCWASTGWRVAFRSGNWGFRSLCGLFLVAMTDPFNYADGSVSSRLLYIPQ